MHTNISSVQVGGPLSARPKESFKVLWVQIKIRHQKKKTNQTSGQGTPIDIVIISNLNHDLTKTAKHVAPSM